MPFPDDPTLQKIVMITVVILAVGLSIYPRTRYLPQLFTTLTHEFGHGISVMPFGGRLKGMKLSLNTEGEAVVTIPQYPWPFYQLLRILNLLAGYSAPIYFSIFVLASILNQWDTALTWVMVGTTVLMTLFIRNWAGVLIVSVFIIANIVFIWWLPLLIPYMTFLAICSFICGIIDIGGAVKYSVMKKGKAPHTDFHIASEELRMPPLFWVIVFFIVHVPVWFVLFVVIWQTSPLIN